MFSELKSNLFGCFYTVFTPFAESGEIDFDALKRYLEFNYERGARRFYAMAYNSRYSQLSFDEIYRLNEFCIRTIKALDKSNIIIVGDPIHCSTAVSAEFAAHARDCGGDLISLIFREKYFDDEQVLDHFDQIGRATKFPILVHEMPFLSGYDGNQMHWPLSLFRLLPGIPYIAALKEDAKSFEITTAALALEPQIRIVIAGRKSEFIKYREHGARAYLNGISIIDAKIGEMFWAAYERGDDALINTILEDLEAPFFDTCVKQYGWHRTNKALLQAADLMHRRDRMPIKHLNDTEYTLVESCYEKVNRSWKTLQERSDIGL